MHTTEQYRDIVEQELRDLSFPATPPGLFAPVRYALDCGGKRLRPVLTLAVAEALGASVDDAIVPALAVEIFHNFTLLHDDVMDHAELRRGRPTVHCKWDDTTAILSGDAMLTYASQLLDSECIDPKIYIKMNRLFNSTAMDVYRGQQYDMDFEKRTDVTEEEYIEMIRLKTSVLLGCACAMGAIAAGVPETTVDLMYSFGEMLGLAFQLRDDYLDTYGDPVTFGKEVGGDIINDKKTWLSVMAMNDERSCDITEIFGDMLPAPEKIKRVRGLYDRAELPVRIRSLITEYSDKAIDAVKKTGLPEDALIFFVQLTDKLCSREV